MDGQFTSSGFQLYGQQLHGQGLTQTGQALNQTPTPQVGGGYAFISPGTGTAQTSLNALRGQGVQILQTDSTGQPKTQQQTALGATAAGAFQTAQGAQASQQTQQQRVHTSQLQGLSTQQLQYLQSQQGGGQVSAQSLQQQYSPNAPSLGAIQIIPQKNPAQGATASFQQGQSLQASGQGIQSLQGVPTPTATSLQSQQTVQNLQSLQALQGYQNVPGVQVLQQYPGYNSQLQNQQKTAPVGGNAYQAVGQNQLLSAYQQPGTGRQGESLFSNSNQHSGGGFGRNMHNWNERDRGDFRGTNRDRGRRDDKGPHRPIGRGEHMPKRISRDRDNLRRDRGRDRFDHGYRDVQRRDTGFSRDRERRSPARFHDVKRMEDIRKEPKRETSLKSVETSKDVKALPTSTTPPRTAAEYAVKIPQVSFATYERDYSDIARRYTHLHVSPDFTRMVCQWVKATGGSRHSYGCTLCPLNKPIKFEMIQAVHEPDVEIILPAAKNNVNMSKRWNAKCTFMCGVDSKTHNDILKGKFEGGTHLLNALKFVTVREEKEKKKTGIMCLGGPYDPALDGGDPSQDINCLRTACVRHVKDQTMLDLALCPSWTRFCDIHYRRVDSSGDEYDEVTVIFLVDVSEIVSSLEDWPTAWQAQQDWKHDQEKQEEIQKEVNGSMNQEVAVKNENTEEATSEQAMNAPKVPADSTQESEAPVAIAVAVAVPVPVQQKEQAEMPKEPSLLMKCRSAKNGKVKTMCISLDGLLDYDESDKDEATFELSLFAESFNEMLMRDYGKLVLEALLQHKASKIESKVEEKRRRSVEVEEQEPMVKKAKQEEIGTEMESVVEETKEQTQEGTEGGMEAQYQDSPGDVVHVSDIEHQPEDVKVTVKAEVTEEIKPEIEKVVEEDIKMQEDTWKTEVIVNEELLFAFRYFDRAGCGYIKCDDMRRLLHNLGSCLAPRVVRELVHGAAAIGKEKHKLDRVCYKSLTDKEGQHLKE